MRNLVIYRKRFSISSFFSVGLQVGKKKSFTKEELISIFDADRLSKSPAVFDKNKLTWMNNQYIKKLPLEQVIELALPHLQKSGALPEELTTEQT